MVMLSEGSISPSDVDAMPVIERNFFFNRLTEIADTRRKQQEELAALSKRNPPAKGSRR